MINYDLNKPYQDYDGLIEEIKKLGAWSHYLKSAWLVDTNLSADGVWNRISKHVDTNDNVLIIGVTQDYSGWLPQDAWDWLNSRKNKMAA